MHVIKKCAYLLRIQELAKPDKMQQAAHKTEKKCIHVLELAHIMIYCNCTTGFNTRGKN
jgi:hypothetical protein